MPCRQQQGGTDREPTAGEATGSCQAPNECQAPAASQADHWTGAAVRAWLRPPAPISDSWQTHKWREAGWIDDVMWKQQHQDTPDASHSDSWNAVAAAPGSPAFPAVSWAGSSTTASNGIPGSCSSTHYDDGDRGSDASSGVSSSQPPLAVTSQSIQASKTAPCRHYMNGFCSWDAKCRFSHVRGDPEHSDSLPQSVALAQGDDSDAVPEDASKETGNEKDREQQEAEAEKDERPAAALRTQDPGVWLRADPRAWAHIYLHPAHAGFMIVPVLIGKGGKHMRNIFIASGSKLRIRGRGSGHIEVDGRWEAPVHLMLAITAHRSNTDGFVMGVDLAVQRLLEVENLYDIYCEQNGLPLPTLAQPLFSFAEVSPMCVELLKDFVAKWPRRSYVTVNPGSLPPTSEPADLADAGAQPAANARPLRIRARQLKPSIHLPPEGPLPSAIQCQEILRAAEAAMQAACTGGAVLPCLVLWQLQRAVAHAKQALERRVTMDSQACACPAVTPAVSQAAYDCKAAVIPAAAVTPEAPVTCKAAVTCKATCKQEIAAAERRTDAFNRSITFTHPAKRNIQCLATRAPPDASRHPATFYMDMAGRHGTCYANQFSYAAASEYQGAGNAYNVGLTLPGDFGNWPHCSWPHDVGAWPHDFGAWPHRSGAWLSDAASQWPQSCFNPAEGSLTSPNCIPPAVPIRCVVEESLHTNVLELAGAGQHRLDPIAEVDDAATSWEGSVAVAVADEPLPSTFLEQAPAPAGLMASLALALSSDAEYAIAVAAAGEAFQDGFFYNAAFYEAAFRMEVAFDCPYVTSKREMRMITEKWQRLVRKATQQEDDAAGEDVAAHCGEAVDLSLVRGNPDPAAGLPFVTQQGMHHGSGDDMDAGIGSNDDEYECLSEVVESAVLEFLQGRDMDEDEPLNLNG